MRGNIDTLNFVLKNLKETISVVIVSGLRDLI